jgi:hypothetical protein
MLKTLRFACLISFCSIASLLGFGVLLGSFVLPAQAQSLKLSPGFTPQPTTLSGTGGGSTPVSSVIGRTDSPTGDCTGFANTQPNHTIVLTAPFSWLALRVRSADDTALMIQGPGGIWCNDDLDGKNPGIVGEWLPGTYRIWITSYDRGQSPPYTLQLSEAR